MDVEGVGGGSGAGGGGRGKVCGRRTVEAVFRPIAPLTGPVATCRALIGPDDRAGRAPSHVRDLPQHHSWETTKCPVDTSQNTY